MVTILSSKDLECLIGIIYKMLSFYFKSKSNPWTVNEHLFSAYYDTGQKDGECGF